MKNKSLISFLLILSVTLSCAQPSVEAPVPASPEATELLVDDSLPSPITTPELVSEPSPELVLMSALELVFEDDFSNPDSGWPVKSDTPEVLEYGYSITDSRSEYHIISKKSQQGNLFTNRSLSEYDDFILQADCSADAEGAYGLNFRVSVDSLSRYFFWISTAGEYSIVKCVAGECAELVKWTESHYIEKGSNRVNRLMVQCRGSEIKVFANDHRLATINDSALKKGLIGMEVHTFGQPVVQFTFDNFCLMVSPPSEQYYEETNTPDEAEEEYETPTPETTSRFHGWCPGPHGLAITPDGKKAYVSFSYDDTLLAVDLTDFETTEQIDVSSAGSMLSSGATVLSQDGSKLFVANSQVKNVLMINTVDDTVEKVFPVATLWRADSLSAAPDGTEVYVTSTDGNLYIISCLDNSYRKVSRSGIVFESVEPSLSQPELLYCIGRYSSKRAFFTFDLSRNSVVRSIELADEILPPDTNPGRLTIDSDETRAYFTPYPLTSDKGVGNFNVLDLNSFQILVSTPIECGITDFAVNEELGKIYIIGFWSGGGSPGTGYIREWDILTDNISREIFISPSSDARAIAIDPVDPDYLYMTEADFNLLRKVEISTGKEVAQLQFNKDDISPHDIIKGDTTGYVVCRHSRDVYKLDLNSGQLMGTLTLPEGASSNGGYYDGKLFFAGGSHIYCVDPSDGSLIETFDIGGYYHPGLFTFFDDKMATIDFEPGGMIGRKLLIFNTANMTILKSISLPYEPHGKSVIVSPDGSKLYVSRGLMMGGPAVVTILDAATFEVINTIDIPYEFLHTGSTCFLEADFDEKERVLYLSGFISVYKIDMDTDKLIENITVIDVLESLWKIKKGGWCPTGVAGVVLSSTKDKLFVISGDAHCMYIYNLINSSWTPQITNLDGYFITDTERSPDGKYLYTVNEKSDSITMVNLMSGELVRVIRL